MRIAIVNDLPLAVEAMRRAVTAVPGYRLAWVACNGEDAVERCREDTPDLILMDLMMPVMDGVEAIRRIMAQSPCPILVVTATVDGYSGKVFEALGAGAVDVVQTPTLGGTGQTHGMAALKFKIDAVGRRLPGERADQRLVRPNGGKPIPPSTPADALIVIGASAGGPATLATILGGLPRNFPAAVVIIQHVDAQFVPLMADWLNDRSSLSVRIACQGERPQSNTVLIAGTNDHMVLVNSLSLSYTPHPRDSCYRPSIDVFFESVAAHWAGSLVGVLLTGMGRDGAKGLKAIRDAGYMTVAQDSASCAVYGMPKAAVEIDAAARILSVNDIAHELIEFVTSSRRTRRTIRG